VYHQTIGLCLIRFIGRFTGTIDRRFLGAAVWRNERPAHGRIRRRRGALWRAPLARTGSFPRVDPAEIGAGLSPRRFAVMPSSPV